MKKKHSFTLLEIMIVIFLIGIIGSIIGYSMTGTLDRGRAFKTEQGQQRLQDLLELQLANGTEQDQIINNTVTVIKELGMVKNPNDLIKDGWKNPYKIEVIDGEVKVTSEKLRQYRKANGKNEEKDEF